MDNYQASVQALGLSVKKPTQKEAVLAIQTLISKTVASGAEVIIHLVAFEGNKCENGDYSQVIKYKTPHQQRA